MKIKKKGKTNYGEGSNDKMREKKEMTDRQTAMKYN